MTQATQTTANTIEARNSIGLKWKAAGRSPRKPAATMRVPPQKGHQMSTTDTSNSFQFNWSGSVIPNLVAWALIGLIAAATAQKTGQTIGRKMAKTQLPTEAGAVPSFGVIFARSLLHILDNLVCCLGFLFPLWDKQRQTFADKIMKTYVVDVERTGPINTQP